MLLRQTKSWIILQNGGILMLLAVTGFVMIFLIIYLLLQSKVHPTPIFVVVPIVCAVVCGFDFAHCRVYENRRYNNHASRGALHFLNCLLFDYVGSRTL